MASVRRPLAAKVNTPSFPILTNVDVLQLLFAMGINVQMDDIAKPTPQSSQFIFTALVDNLMGASMDMIEGPKATLMGSMEYKELYGDALQFTMFFRHCREMATVCGIHNFSISDLTRPDATRFRHHLSGVLNMAKFREDKEGRYDVFAAKLRNQVEQSEKAKLQLERVENTIEEITLKNAQDRPLTEAAKKRNDGIRAELLNLRSEQFQLSHTVENLKSERQQIMEQAASKNNELTNLTQSTLAAKSRLVQSPDRIKKHISEMSSTVAAEKSSLASIQRKTRDLGSRLEIIGGLEADLKGLIELERKVDEQRAKVEEMKRGLMRMKAGCEGKQIESDGMKARLDQLDRQLTNAQDKFQRQQVALGEMRVRSKTRMDDLRATYVTQKKERAVWEKTIQGLKAEQAALDQEMAAFTATHETEINELLSHYWSMRRQAEEYMKTVNGKLNLGVRGL